MDRDVLLFLIGVCVGFLVGVAVCLEPKEELRPTLEELKQQNENLQVELIIMKNKKLLDELEDY